jgi:hypothetical protein
MTKPSFTRFVGFLFHVCRIKKSAVQVRISLSLFIIVNYNMEQTSERSYEKTNRQI